MYHLKKHNHKLGMTTNDSEEGLVFKANADKLKLDEYKAIAAHDKESKHYLT